LQSPAQHKPIPHVSAEQEKEKEKVFDVASAQILFWEEN